MTAEGITGIVLGIVGIIATILVAAFIKTVVKKRSQTQRQSIGKGGMGIQSGRDTTFKQ